MAIRTSWDDGWERRGTEPEGQFCWHGGGVAAGEAPSEPLTAEKTEASGSHRPNAELGFVPKPRGVSSVRVAAESQRRKRPREGP